MPPRRKVGRLVLGSPTSHSLNRRTATLIRRGPSRWNLFRRSDFGEFLGVSVRPSKLLHVLVYRIRVNRIGGLGRHVRSPPAAKLIWLFPDEDTVMLADVFPAEHLLRG